MEDKFYFNGKYLHTHHLIVNRKPQQVISVQEQGQEPILPAVLEFPETHQDTFLRHVITGLDVNAPNFKLAPVYTLYLCAR